MGYEVTATRKRPQVFDELTGQDFVVSTLKNSISTERIAHAYLFAGPRGVGKTSTARILARALNCDSGPTVTPCGKCPACQEISRGNSLDVIEIDGASNTSVNDVREIKDEVLFAPNICKYKVYIIDEVHMLSNSAFNALLKTIEEPPPYIIFIFATTEIHKVPATIRSRCQQFNFRLIPVEDIKYNLQGICEELKIDAEDEALFWIAKEATGSLRDAYTLFDQVLSFSGSKINMKSIQEKLGLVGFDHINIIAELMAEGKAREAIEQTDDIYVKGVSVEQFIIDLTEYFRNVLFLKHRISKESILGYQAERFSKSVLERFSVSQTEQAIEILLQLYRDIRFSLNQKFELELVISRLSVLSEYLTPGEILGKINELRSEIINGKLVSSAESAVDGGDEKSLSVLIDDDQKQKVILAVRKKKLTLASALEKSTTWELSSDKLTITFVSAYSADCVEKDLPVLSENFRDVTGIPAVIRVKVQGTGNNPEKVIGDEKIELVKKVFRGEIIRGEESV